MDMSLNFNRLLLLLFPLVGLLGLVSIPNENELPAITTVQTVVSSSSESATTIFPSLLKTQLMLDTA